MRASSVLRVAAALDCLIALLLVATPFLRLRVGLPITLIVATVIAIGAAVLLVIAARLDRS